MKTLDLEHMKRILVSMFGENVFDTVGGFANVDGHQTIILHVTKEITEFGQTVGYVFLYPVTDQSEQALYSLQQKDYSKRIHMFPLKSEQEMKDMLIKYFDNRLFKPSIFQTIFKSLIYSQQPIQHLTKEVVEEYLRSIFDHEFFSKNVRLYADHINILLPNKKIHNLREYTSLDIVINAQKIECFYCDTNRFASTECTSLDDLRKLLLRIFDEYAQIKVINDYIPETLAELHARVAILETRFNHFIQFANSGTDGIKKATEKNDNDITTLAEHLDDLTTFVHKTLKPEANQAFQSIYSRLENIESFLSGQNVGNKRPASATAAVGHNFHRASPPQAGHRPAPPHPGGNSMDMSSLRHALPPTRSADGTTGGMGGLTL